MFQSHELLELTETKQLLDQEEKLKNSIQPTDQQSKPKKPIAVIVEFPQESSRHPARIISRIDLQQEPESAVYLFEQGRPFNFNQYNEPIDALDIEEAKDTKGEELKIAGEWISVQQPYSTTLSTQRQKYVFLNSLPGEAGSFEKTNNIEVTAGMPLNSVRVFIWNGFYKNAGIYKLLNHLGLIAQTNGHIGMCIKDEKEEVTHISLYYDNEEQKRGQSALKINIGKKSRFLRYFNRDENKASEKGDYETQAAKNFSLYRYSADTVDKRKIEERNFGNAVIVTKKGAYVTYNSKVHHIKGVDLIEMDTSEAFAEEKSPPKNRAPQFENINKHFSASNIITKVLLAMGDGCEKGLHADYVIEIVGFTSAEINRMLDLYQKKKDVIRWRLLGDLGCCLEARGSISKYQNCSSLSYNILKAGNFSEKLPDNLRLRHSKVRKISSILGKEIARFVLWFLVFWGVSELINRYVLSDPFTEEQGIKFSALLSLGRSAVATMLFLCWKCCNLCVVGEKEESLSPMSFKKILLDAATTSDPTSKVRLVHTAETLQNVLVVATQQKTKLDSSEIDLRSARPVARYREAVGGKSSKFFLEYIKNDNDWLFNLLNVTRQDVGDKLDVMLKENNYLSEAYFCIDFCRALFYSQQNYLVTQDARDNPISSWQGSERVKEFLALFARFQGLSEQKDSEVEWNTIVGLTLNNKELIQSYIESLQRKGGIRLELPIIYYLAKELNIGLKIFNEQNGMLNLEEKLQLKPDDKKPTLNLLKKGSSYSVLQVDNPSLSRTYVNIFKPRAPAGTPRLEPVNPTGTVTSFSTS